MIRRILLLICFSFSFFSTPIFAEDNYDKNTVLDDAENFFGEGTEGLGEVIEKIFKKYGEPNAVIKGEEASGALGIGARYGNSTLTMKSGGNTTVHWTGPSIGFDAGANASKVFVLVYHLHNTADIFQRFPGVEGTFYFVAGVGVNYQQSGDIILAPMRTGVGLRAGANIGYLHYTEEQSWWPF